ncbi:MAG: MFS transporter [Actinomycetia bacterium]|nr:MFS transporter [Actinomycetes bacterium]MCP5032366.1 MFS transporter [Actinomycetes bacterium]
MLQIPLRLALLLRPSVGPSILLAVGFSTFVMASTPFLVDLVVDEYDIGLALASLIGVAQLGGFVIGSWGSGRWLSPRRRVFVAAMGLAVVTNLASSVLPPFAVLVGLRFGSGLALGLITWFAWVQVFGQEREMGDLAVMGPITGIAAAPLIAVFAVGGGPAAVFALLGTVAIIPLLFSRGSGAADRVPDKSRRSKPIPAALVLLAALGIFTMGGSSIVQYAVVLGGDNAGLTTQTVSLVFSANALAGIPSAKWPWRRGFPGPWLAGTAGCALLLATTNSGIVFALAFVFWGFAFWMAIPGVFNVLATRSAHPADRAGDAQAVMAGGRVIGPLLGGLLLDASGSTALGLVGGGLMLTGAAAVFGVRSMASVRDEPVGGEPIDDIAPV